MMTSEINRNANRKTRDTYIHITWMLRRHQQEVLEIENLCFSDAWTEDDFIRSLRQRNCIGQVVELCDTVGGYMIYEFHQKHIQLTNIAVLPRLHGKGIGRAMIDKLKCKLSNQRRSKIIAYVRETNLDAQLFFRAVGFKCVEIDNDFHANGEPAYRFEFGV